MIDNDTHADFQRDGSHRHISRATVGEVRPVENNNRMSSAIQDLLTVYVCVHLFSVLKGMWQYVRAVLYLDLHTVPFVVLELYFDFYNFYTEAVFTSLSLV